MVSNQVTKGYKLTQLGEIPEEWGVVKLGEVCKVKSSKRVFQSDYVDFGVPFYRSKEINELSNGKLPSTELYISREHYNDIKARFGVPEKGDLLITSIGTIGNTWVSDGGEFYYKDGNITQINKNDVIPTNFISYLFKSDVLRKQYIGQSSGSAQMALTIEKINKLVVPLPSLKEQNKIVRILSIVDEAIEKTEAIIKQTEKVKKGLMQQLFTKGVGHTKFKKTEIGKIPEDWEVKTLNELNVLVTSGSRGWSKYYSERGALFIRSQDIGFARFKDIERSYVEIPDGIEGQRTLIKAQDILISITGEPGHVVSVPVGFGKAYVSQHVALVRLIDPDFAPFITYFLCSDIGQSQFENMAYGQTRPGLNLTNIKDLLVPIPPIEEQLRIVDILASFDEKIVMESRLLNAFRILKKSLMQSLLTGKVRVKVDESEVTQV